MGLDWRQTTWGEYQVALAGWNAAHDTEAPKGEADTSRLARALKAHMSLQ